MESKESKEYKMDICKRENESIKQFTIRLFQNKETLHLSNNDIAKLINEASGCRKDESSYRKWYKAYIEGYRDAQNLQTNGGTDKLEALKLKAEMLKKQAQTERLETNKWLRENARKELLYERMCDIIKDLPPIEFTKGQFKTKGRSTGLLCIADAHNGININMTTVSGDTVNVYSPEILKERLDKLLNMVVVDAERYFSYDKLVVFDLGDAIQNILRMSDIAKLKMGVLESVMDYANTISHWLVELSERLKVNIDYYCLGGNHAEMRLLEAKKNFPNENLGMVIREFIALRLQNNSHITVAPFTETAYAEIEGVHVLAYHGEDSKKDDMEITFWENYHNISIDILIEGHLHHHEQQAVGYSSTGDKEVIKVPSLMGVDVYSKKIRKMSRAGAKFLLFEDNQKTFERTYVLN